MTLMAIGKKKQVVTYYLQDREIAFATKNELKQIPIIKMQFLYATDFAKAYLTEIFMKVKLEVSQKFPGNYFQNDLLSILPADALSCFLSGHHFFQLVSSIKYLVAIF